MLFSDRARSHYRNSPLHEVICQLRFPTILSINDNEPAAFQEQIRADFPLYERKQETPPPKLVNGRAEASAPISNYHFFSADHRWKLNVTRDFIALSTLAYPDWETFARKFDRPLAYFIQCYQPACFQRVGLRYVNLVSRKKLGVEDREWSELIAEAYLGPAGEEDVAEEQVIACGFDLQLRLDSSCVAKIHAGPGHIRVNGANAQQDNETKFIFDMDLSMGGDTPCGMAAAALETLHGHSTRLFEGFLTDTLREAMDAE
ncbi:MAG: TIGR04255 family protein [Oscillibacter sp.]|nr:TIGR04255 family protein [Oscillibacter sp.]